MIAARQTDLYWRANGVVELRVGNEPTRIIDLAVLRTEWVTIIVDAAARNCIALELILADTLDISTMVLIEIGQFVVKQDWRLKIVWNGDLDLTNRILRRSLVRKQGPGCRLR